MAQSRESSESDDYLVELQNENANEKLDKSVEGEELLENIDELKKLINDDKNDEDENLESLYFSDDDQDSGEVDDDDDQNEDDDDDDDDDESGDEEMGVDDEPPSIDFGFSSDDDDYDVNEDENLMNDEFEFKNILREATNMKTKKRKGGLASLKAKSQQVDPEVRMLLSTANEAFVRRDYQEALESFLKVVELDPKNFSAYKTMGEIYKQQGRLSKCCNIWFLAAILQPWDSEFWNEVGELSQQLGHTRQALHCFSKAVSSSKNKNLKAIFNRGVIFRETDQFVRASESFTKLLQINPTNSAIVKELALVYVSQNRINDAINLYARILEQNKRYRELLKKNPDARLNTVKFDWSELNILAELHGKQTAWISAIKVVKEVARWIQHREDQTWWSDTNDDSEFDGRRLKNPKFQALASKEKSKAYGLPIDIRIQLGFFRLNLNYIEEAKIHFSHLFEEDVHGSADLYFDVGKALEEHSLHAEALKYLSPLSFVEAYNNNDLKMSLANCYFALNDLEHAKDACESLLREDSGNSKALSLLLEIHYFLGDKEYFEELCERIKKPKDFNHRENDQMEVDEEQQQQDDLNVALIQDIAPGKVSIKKQRRLKKLTDEQWFIKDQTQTSRVKETYFRSEKLLPDVRKGDRYATEIWMDLAIELIEIFASVRNFFAPDKVTKCRALLAERRNAFLDIDERITRMSVIREEIELDKHNNGKYSLGVSGVFRGVTFDQWFELFMQYCLLISKLEGPAAALKLYESFNTVNIFYQDKRRERILSIVGLSLSLKVGDTQLILQYLRAVLNNHQFSSQALKLFLAVFKGDNELNESFSDSSHQKYFLRQIKAFDSLKYGKKITGMATITNEDIDTTHINPYLSYIYAALLHSNKSYISQIAYMSKLYADGFTEDPMICFLIGIGHIHRSIQRLSTNRHFQILQGFSYLLRYKELRTKKGGDFEEQECDYNLGRAFHMLGLFSLATEFYNKVLAKKLGFLEAEASYNLYLICLYNGCGEQVELMTV